jgi:putative glutamine amidotransferase
MQPVIGITMCYDNNSLINEGVEYTYVRREYSLAVQRAGGQPVFLDPGIDPLVAAELCDGIVISGGEDIDAALYHQEKRGDARQEPRIRTDWERQLIDACDEWNRPILGICYGEQLLNVHYGGTLYQDIRDQCRSALGHGTSKRPVLHDIVFEQDFLGFARGEKVAVTARHHQAVRNIAPGFRVVARADDGTIEAISGHGHMGIQWHAESDDSAKAIYGNFVALCVSRTKQAKLLRRAIRPRGVSDFLASLTTRSGK